jgi:hypothetical protein
VALPGVYIPASIALQLFRTSIYHFHEKAIALKEGQTTLFGLFYFRAHGNIMVGAMRCRPEDRRFET